MLSTTEQGDARAVVDWGNRGLALFDPAEGVQTIVDPKDAAVSAGLRYVSDDRPGICRKKSGTGFGYVRPDGTKLSDPHFVRRIRSLAIPPAWTDVWICPFADGHIQAIGRDARRRKQYCYHPLFREARESTKYEHVVVFADALPTIRAKVREHSALRVDERLLGAPLAHMRRIPRRVLAARPVGWPSIARR